MIDLLWTETCWSTFKYFIILIVSTYYILCISWIIKCFNYHWCTVQTWRLHRRCFQFNILNNLIRPVVGISSCGMLQRVDWRYGWTYCLHLQVQAVCSSCSLCFWRWKQWKVWMAGRINEWVDGRGAERKNHIVKNMDKL